MSEVVMASPSVAEVPRGDTDLVRLVGQRREDALSTLYDRYAREVYQSALRIEGDAATAEEVVQETFLALWERAEQFDPLRGSLGAWLSAIARNRALDRLRAAGRRLRATPLSGLAAGADDEAATIEWLVAAADPVAAAVPAAGPEDAAVDRETVAAMRDAIGSLGDEERTVILLGYRHGLSQSEIASELGLPLGTVKSRSRRALMRLRAALEALERPEEAPEVAPASPSVARLAPRSRNVAAADPLLPACCGAA